jgi:DNA-binding NarL/FixJ family response regulator
LSVVVADDCPAMREGLARLIGDECDLMVVNSAATAAELRAVAAREQPRVVVLELMLDDEDGLALIKDLGVLAPAAAIVVFTLHSEEIYAARCLRAGARAYVAKREAVSTLFRAIRETAAGRLVVPACLTATRLNASPEPARSANGLAAQLTDRELQVFRLVGLAQPTRLVAEKLGVSVKTIETHRENIKNKLDLQSHEELIACAARWVRASHT